MSCRNRHSNNSSDSSNDESHSCLNRRHGNFNCKKCYKKQEHYSNHHDNDTYNESENCKCKNHHKKREYIHRRNTYIKHNDSCSRCHKYECEHSNKSKYKRLYEEEGDYCSKKDCEKGKVVLITIN